MYMHDMGIVNESGQKQKANCRCSRKKGKGWGKDATEEGVGLVPGGLGDELLCDPRTLCIYEFPPGF